MDYPAPNYTVKLESAAGVLLAIHMEQVLFVGAAAVCGNGPAAEACYERI